MRKRCRLRAPQNSRLLRLSRLPPLVIRAFSSATEVCEAWGERLAIVTKLAAAQRRVLEAARSLITHFPRPSDETVFKRLCAAAQAPRTSRAAERVVRDKDGAELFRVKQQQGTVVFKLPLQGLSAALLDEIEHTLATAAALREGADLTDVAVSGVAQTGEYRATCDGIGRSESL